MDRRRIGQNRTPTLRNTVLYRWPDTQSSHNQSCRCTRSGTPFRHTIRFYRKCRFHDHRIDRVQQFPFQYIRHGVACWESGCRTRLCYIHSLGNWATDCISTRLELRIDTSVPRRLCRRQHRPSRRCHHRRSYRPLRPFRRSHWFQRHRQFSWCFEHLVRRPSQ